MWRPAHPSDDASIISMSLALFREDPSTHPMTAERIERTLEAFREDAARGRAVVFEAEGGLAGYALLTSFWSNEWGGRVCLIDELYLSPAQRGAGHGTELIEQLAAKSGLFPGDYVALGLEVTARNARAKALYERLGFKGGNVALFRPLRP